MKRAFLSLALIALPLLLFAGNPCKVVSGKAELKSILKESVELPIVFDWSETTYDEEDAVKEKFEDDYDYIIDDCANKFVSGFNEESNGAKLTLSSIDSQYKCVFVVTNVDQYYNVMKFVSGHTARVWGTFRIISSETGEAVAEVKIENAKSSRDLYPKDSYGKTFKFLGEKISSL